LFLNIHLHCLVLDGVYRTTEGVPVFHAVRAPTAGEPQPVLNPIIKRLIEFLTRTRLLIEERGTRYLANTDPDLVLGPLRAAASGGPESTELATVPAKPPRNIAPRADERPDNAQAEDRLDGSRAQQYYAS
jgi:hypothetical protein